MTDLTTALDAIGALISERSKYEGWLAALATKTDVPAHVVERVRSDYAGRLRNVLQGFTTHVPALEAALGDLQARDLKLAEQEQSCRDEHAEGELRHSVGEYDEQQWTQVRTKHEALLSSLSTDRRAVATELAGVQRALSAAGDASQRVRTLGESGGGVATAPVAATPIPAPAPAPVSSNTPTVPAAVVAAATTPAPVESTNGRSQATYRPSPPSTSAPQAVVAERRDSIADELGFLRGPVNTPAARDVGVLSPRNGTPAEPPTLRIVQDTPPSTQTMTPGGTPVTPDAAKTLKCAECGTMNYPTEWYCERCGGELAVL